MLKIIFDTEGQAFEDSGDREVSRILEEIAEKIRGGGVPDLAQGKKNI